MRKVAVFLIALVVVSVCLRASGAGSLKDRLPDDTYGYVAVKDVPEFLGKVRASYAYKQVIESGVLGNLGFIPQFEAVREAWATYVEPLGEILGGEMVLAVLPAVEKGKDPRGAFLLEVAEEPLTKYLAGVIYPLVEEKGGGTEAIDRTGLKIMRLLPDADAPDEPLFLCVKHGLLVGGERIEDVEGLVRGTIAGGLTKGAAYAEFRKAVGEVDVELFVDVPAVLRDATEGNDEARAAISRMGFDHVRSVGWGMLLNESGSLGTLRVATDAPPGGLLALLGRASGDPKSLRYVPQDAAFYMSLRFGSLLEAYQALLQLAQQATGEAEPPAIPGLGDLEEMLEMDLEEEILPAFGGELAVAVWLNTGAPMPSGVVALEVKDKAAAEKLVEKVLALIVDAYGDEVEVSSDQYEGTTIRTLELSEMVSPSCAVVGDFLVVGENPETVETVIHTMTKGPGLDTSDAYKQAMARIGGSGGFTTYMDVNTLGTMLGRVMNARMFGVQGGAGDEETGWGDEPLPRAAALRVDASGVTYRSASRFEFINASVPVMAGMLLPALARARAQAREAASMGNARQIGTALAVYAADNEGMLPEKLSELVQEGYLDDPKVFVHPAGTDAGLIDVNKPETVDEHSDYELLLKGVSVDEIEAPEDTAVLREKREFLKGGRVVVYADGHAKFVRSDDDEE